MGKGRRGSGSRGCRKRPYPLGSCSKVVVFDKKRDWEDATCCVCMECPHAAVLVLCSSHEKGCRPYMCGTSIRYSNCLEQYKKAANKEEEEEELICPLCRGKVKGWTVVEAARKYLNGKKRSCMHDNCCFSGTYKELRKHVKTEHPLGCPREVDPALEQNWRRLERERERDDVISTIRSSMPGGGIVMGDYVIQAGGGGGGGGGRYDDSDEQQEGGSSMNLSVVLLLHAAQARYQAQAQAQAHHEEMLARAEEA